MRSEVARLHALIEENRCEQDREQHHRNAGRDRPILVQEEFRPQGLPDHHALRAAEQVGNDEFPDNGDEAQQYSRDHARQRERQRHQPKRLPAWTAEIGCSLDQAFIHFLEARIEGQHHEGQVRIDQTDIDGRVAGEPCGRFIDQAQHDQELIEQSVALENIDPGVDADQKRRPERQRNQHE